MSLRLDHVGIVVKDIDKGIKLYGDILGLAPWNKGVPRSSRDGLAQTQIPVDDNFIELIQPIDTTDGSETRFSMHLKERGEGLFHLSFFTDEFDKIINSLKAKKFDVELHEINDLFPGYIIRIAWLKPEQTGGFWIEFVDQVSLPDFYGK